MPRKAPLRAVKADETAEKSEPKTILEAAESGSRLDELKAMRRWIARALDDPNTPGRDLASLSRRQLEIGREIEMPVATATDEYHIVKIWNSTVRGQFYPADILAFDAPQHLVSRQCPQAILHSFLLFSLCFHFILSHGFKQVDCFLGLDIKNIIEVFLSNQEQ